MNWTDHAIWWQVYPLGMTGAPIREADPAPARRLSRLLDWLDYAIDLGASGLLLGPIFASTSHGYDTVDHFRIDQRLGGDAEFDALVAGCRSRGLRLVLDGVFSHIGTAHPLVARALAEGENSPAGRLVDIDWVTATPRVFEGHSSLVRLAHHHEETVEFVAEVMNSWLDRGIDGWRLDAAYSVPSEFWAQVLPAVRRRHRDAWFLGEVIHGDYAGFVRASTMDTLTQYELWKAIWSSLLDGNFFELDWTLTRHNELLDEFVPQTFVGNHDVSRIATVVGPDKAVLAATILLTVGGIPSIYYGDEQGFRGVKREELGGDDEVRPSLPEHPQELSALGAPMLRAHQDLIGLRRRHPWLVRARTVAVSLTNTDYRYRVSGGPAEVLEVELSLEKTPSARVLGADGSVLWAWSPA